MESFASAVLDKENKILRSHAKRKIFFRARWTSEISLRASSRWITSESSEAARTKSSGESSSRESEPNLTTYMWAQYLLSVKFCRRKTVEVYVCYGHTLDSKWSCLSNLVYNDAGKRTNAFVLFRCPIAITYVGNTTRKSWSINIVSTTIFCYIFSLKFYSEK